MAKGSASLATLVILFIFYCVSGVHVPGQSEVGVIDISKHPGLRGRTSNDFQQSAGSSVEASHLRFPAKAGNLQLKTGRALCTQIDIGVTGGILKVHGALMGGYEFDLAKKTVSIYGMVGVGLSLNAIIFKASVYVQGQIKITGTVPATIQKPIDALKWSLLYYVNEQKRLSGLSRIIKYMSKSDPKAGIQQLLETSSKIRKSLQTKDADVKDVYKVADDEKTTKAIIDSANELYLTLAGKIRESASKTLKTVEGIKDETKFFKTYQDNFETMWRGVYMNDPTVKGEGMFDKRPNCAGIKNAKPIQPLMCSFFANGLLLPKPEAIKHGNRNTHKMYEVAYPDMFGVDPKTEKKSSAGVVSFLKGVVKRYERQVKRIALAKTAKDDAALERRTNRMKRTLGPRSIFSMFSSGHGELLSLPHKELEKTITAFQKPNDESKACADCKCGLTEVELQGTMGATFGGSEVGFCTPDSNPVQITAVSKFVWTKTKVPETKSCGLKYNLDDSTDVVTFTLQIQSYGGIDVSLNQNPNTGDIDSVDIQLRARVPFSQAETLTFEKDMTLVKGSDVNAPAEAFGKAVTTFFEQGTAKKWSTAFLKSDVGNFFTKATGGILAQGGFLGKIKGTFENGLTKFVTNSVAKVLTNIASNAAKALTGVSVKITSDMLIGIDVAAKEIKGKKIGKLMFALDYLNVKGAQGEVPTGTGLTVGVQGYYLDNKRAEFEVAFT